MKKIGIFLALLMVAGLFAFAQSASVSYAAGMNTGSWTAFVKDGDEGGESGRKRQAEMIRIRASDSIEGTVKYRVSAGGKWSDWKYGNEIAGESGKPIEAIQVELTGELDDKYDVQYTVFQDNKWTNWISNGDTAGTPGSKRYVEAYQVILTENKAGKRPRGGKRAPPPPPPAPPGQKRGR